MKINHFANSADKSGMEKVLLIEDDLSIAESLKINLKVNGFEVTHSPTLKAASGALAKGKFDLLLLDVNLPDGSGFDFCAELRKTQAETPVIMLTAKTDEDSVVKGLASGATDYMRKPFGVNELVARMKRFLRKDVLTEKSIAFGDLKLHPTDRRVVYREEVLSLTKREFDILALLIRRGGGVVTREHVLGAIDAEGNIFEGTLVSHISNLRAKLRSATKDEMKIAAVYGQGYRLEKR